jgi:ADP-dependent NAD(P)H-hydrate dehydratase
MKGQHVERGRADKRQRARKQPRLINMSLLRRWPLPKLDGQLGKDDRGRVLVVGGSEQIPGAVILAAIGALRAGAGKLQIATSRSVASAVAISVPEARVIGLRQKASGELAKDSCRLVHDEAARCDALLIGPGMVDPAAGAALLRHCVAQPIRAPIVVDAAPLSAFSDTAPKRLHAAGIVLTPHAGEMARLCGIERQEVLAHPLQVAHETAQRLNAVVVLKGAHTYLAGPDGTAFHNVAGNVGLGTSGSGDTLAGIIAGLCARGAEPMQAAVWGVYLHAKAGDVLAKRIGRIGFLARELLSEIPALLSRVT